MDYFDVIKQAARVAWRHKSLWILGFFATVVSGGTGGGGGSPQYSTSSWSPDAPVQPAEVVDWFSSNIALIIGVAMAFGILAIGFWVLGIAARGGLIHEVDQAERTGSVSLGRGWGRGFHFFWRIFGISFVLALPFVLVGMLVAGVLVFAFIVPFVAGSGEPGPELAGLILLSVCGLGILALLIIPVAIIVSIIREVAMRYAVIMDLTFGAAISEAWKDLRAKRGSFVMWLVMIIPGIVYGIVLLIVSLIVLVPAGLFAFGGEWVAAAAMGLVLMLLLIVPTAAYNTFYSASWTVFFRRMTGMDPAHTLQVPPQPAGTTAPPASGTPTAPPPAV